MPSLLPCLLTPNPVALSTFVLGPRPVSEAPSARRRLISTDFSQDCASFVKRAREEQLKGEKSKRKRKSAGKAITAAKTAFYKSMVAEE